MIMVIILACVCVLALYLYNENTFLQVTKYNVVNNKISKGFEGYKIAHISDFHNTTSKRLSNSILKKIKEHSVNIAVITGDLIDSRRTNTKVALNFIDKLVKITKVYYVPGNHESRLDIYENFKCSLIDKGVIVLENSGITIEERGETIKMLGIKDPAFYCEDMADNADTVKEKISALEYDKKGFNLLLSHRPEIFDVYVEQDLDLVLAGHAHGGQIRIPFAGGVLSPWREMFAEYTSGMHTKNTTSMIISRGIGNSLFPFRINNRPELIIVKLNTK